MELLFAVCVYEIGNWGRNTSPVCSRGFFWGFIDDFEERIDKNLTTIKVNPNCKI